MNKLIVLSGPPGSGKSYFSFLLKQRADNQDVYVVSSDQLRAEYGENQQDFSHEEEIWAMYYKRAEDYSKNKNGICILDSTNARKSFRIDKTTHLKPLYDEINLVIFKLDKETVLRQNLDREYPIPQDALIKLIDRFEFVTQDDEEYFDNIYIIDERDLTPIIDKIVK